MDLDYLTEVFSYLDDLRDSGATNMFGASPYLEEQFNMSRKVSQKLLGLWMKTFKSDVTPEERAKVALEKENK